MLLRDQPSCADQPRIVGSPERYYFPRRHLHPLLLLPDDRLLDLAARLRRTSATAALVARSMGPADQYRRTRLCHPHSLLLRVAPDHPGHSDKYVSAP